MYGRSSKSKHNVELWNARAEVGNDPREKSNRGADWTRARGVIRYDIS